MSSLNRFWASTMRFFKSLEGMDDPVGDYIFSLGKRVDKLERDQSRLDSQLHQRSDGDKLG